MADRIGQHLGNYRLTSLLGKGGFAEVYLGEHLFLGTTAAIKVLHTQVAPEYIAQFQQEARFLASLKHPHIVNILDFGIEKQTPYLIMAYAPHGSLRTRHPKGTILPIATVVSYVDQVAQALQHAHECKIVHRDINPRNMLIGAQDEILLSDFGIALISQSSRSQNTRDILGTIAYMAPEQIAGHPRTASDQYALGVVAYEWLCGTLPFHGSFTEIAVQHSVTPPPSPLQYIPTLSPAIEQVIMTALAKQPEARFTSVRAFANALKQASLGAPPAARVYPVTPSFQWSPSDISVLSPTVVTLPSEQSLNTLLTQADQPVLVPAPTRPNLPIQEREADHPKAFPQRTGTSRRLTLLKLTGLVVIAALVGSLIWSVLSHIPSFGSNVRVTPTGSVVHHPALAGNITEFTVLTSASGPSGITAGPDGNLWFTEQNGNKIGRISTNGAITEFAIPTLVSEPSLGITAGPDGNLWFTEQNGNKIGRISTNGAITEFAIPTPASHLDGIIEGPDGYLWFAEQDGNKIGRISTSGAITEFSVPTSASGPSGIAAGSDGNLWFAAWASNKIGRISTSGIITEFAIPTPTSHPGAITAGPDGRLWFVENSGNKVGRISISGIIVEFAIPTPTSDPGGITAGPDGNLWFTEYNGNKIGRISTSGAITEFSIPTSASHPWGGITVGPDGNLWFTEAGGNKIGRITSGK